VSQIKPLARKPKLDTLCIARKRRAPKRIECACARPLSPADYSRERFDAACAGLVARVAERMIARGALGTDEKTTFRKTHHAVSCAESFQHKR
jgi:hypothetical protein